MRSLIDRLQAGREAIGGMTAPVPPAYLEEPGDEILAKVEALGVDGDAAVAESLPVLGLGQLTSFERRVSDDRRARFDRLDALSAELVRRYREGEATVDGLLG